MTTFKIQVSNQSGRRKSGRVFLSIVVSSEVQDLRLIYVAHPATHLPYELEIWVKDQHSSCLRIHILFKAEFYHFYNYNPSIWFYKTRNLSKSGIKSFFLSHFLPSRLHGAY